MIEELLLCGTSEAGLGHFQLEPDQKPVYMVNGSVGVTRKMVDVKV